MRYIYGWLYWCFRFVNHKSYKAMMFFYKCKEKSKLGKPLYQVGDIVIIKDSSPEDYNHKFRVIGYPRLSLGESVWYYLCQDMRGHKVHYKEWALTT